jgi:hypothetical protein
MDSTLEANSLTVLGACQFCDNQTTRELLFLGYLPPVNSLKKVNSDTNDFTSHALSFSHCQSCSLTQLSNSLPRDVVFPDTYPYLSGMTKSLVDNFKEQATKVTKVLKLEGSDLIVDIGSNDGSLLKQYVNFTRILGVEPTQAADSASAQGIPTIKSYFDHITVDHIVKNHGKAKLITACNVFAHIPDLHGLMKNIKNLLDNDGVFISESHYLVDLVENLQFDTIYHEHLRYYTVFFLKKLMASYGLEIFNVEKIESHGGSIRVWASKPGLHQVKESVDELVVKEISKYISFKDLKLFSDNVKEWRQEFRFLISGIRKNGGSISAIGAPSRASTLVSYSGLTENDIHLVGELPGSAKIGHFMPGTRILITEEKEVLLSRPDYLIILSWHLANDIIPKLKAKGFKGKFIIPLPKPRIIEL